MDIFLIAGGGAALSTFQRPREDKKGIPVLKGGNRARLKKKKVEETEAAMQTTGVALEDRGKWGGGGGGRMPKISPIPSLRWVWGKSTTFSSGCS